MTEPELPERLTTAKDEQTGLFSQTTTTPVPAAGQTLPELAHIGPPEFRDTGIPPLHRSVRSVSRALRFEFLRGAQELGLDTARKPLHPQQFQIADVLNSGFSTVGICVPRRASKTTSILAVLIGRCFEREDYSVAYSAQSGTKARDRFLLDVVKPLERRYPDADTRPFRINRSRGGEHITFDNGSRFVVLPPLSDSFRGDAFDAVCLDESQAHDVDVSEDLVGSIVPTFDTRPGAQLIVAGTTGKHRSALLWSTLEDGRAGRADTGILEYSAGDFLTEEDMADPEVWQRAHPGISTLTTLDVVRRNFEKLPLGQFAAEYLGVWPSGGGGRFLNAEKWDAARIQGELPPIPDHFSIGIAVHPMQTAACIALAWRDPEGVAHIGILEHRAGVQWVAGTAVEIARKHKTVIAHDTFGPVLVEVEAMNRAKPRPRMAPQSMRDVQTSAATLVKALETGTLRHYDQEEMNEAARLAVKRKIGNGWGLGRGSDDDDILALEAASYALHDVDNRRQRPAFVPIMSE